MALIGAGRGRPVWTPDESGTGVFLQTDLGHFGPGGRALYDPRLGNPACWDWSGDSP